VGIADDIKKKKIPQKIEKKANDEITDPDEVSVRVAKNTKDYSFYDTDVSLEQKEEDFFQPDPPAREEEEQKPAEKELDNHQGKKTGNPMTKWVVLLILILIGLLVWQNYSKILDLIGLNKTSNPSTESSLSDYSSSSSGTDYTNKSNPAANSSAPTADQSQSATTATAPTIDKTKITIEVLNGNGISGTAAKVKNQLVNAGFTVDKVANAYKFTYQSTIIYYKTGKSGEADLVKTALSDRQSETNNNDSVVGNYDIAVVVGKK